MDILSPNNYQVVEKAIGYLVGHFKQKPNINQIAEYVHLKPADFEQIFADWAGVSFKKFEQFIGTNYFLQVLDNTLKNNLFSNNFDQTVIANPPVFKPRLIIERYQAEKDIALINYSFSNSYFGKIVIANTEKGVCYLAFYTDKDLAVSLLKSTFPTASYTEKTAILQLPAIAVLQNNFTILTPIKLHLKGTDFQLKVWETLLNIPFGALSTYGKIAQQITSPKSARAVGTAIGNNPIAVIIPCHRVIQNSGKLGGYMWGLTKKCAILGWEASQKS